MTREDIKTVNREIMRKRLLDEYGSNSLKIEELQKQLKLYKYNKFNTISAYIVGVLTAIVGIVLTSTSIIPLTSMLALPIISTVSVFNGTFAAKVVSKFKSDESKYELFQSKKNRKKIEEEKLDKICKIEKLKARNNIITKSLDILHKRNINLKKKDLSSINMDNDLEKLDKLVEKKVHFEELKSNNSILKNTTPESKYLTSLGILNLGGLGFFSNPTFASIGSNIIYTTTNVLSIAAVISSFGISSINSIKNKIKLKKDIISNRDNTIENNNISYLDNERHISNLTYDIAYNKIDMLEQDIINDVVSSKDENNSKKYIKNCYKLKAASIKKNKKEKIYVKKRL